MFNLKFKSANVMARAAGRVPNHVEPRSRVSRTIMGVEDSLGTVFMQEQCCEVNVFVGGVLSTWSSSNNDDCRLRRLQGEFVK